MIEPHFKKRYLKQELEEVFQNIEAESIKSIVNKDYSLLFSKFSLVWLHYIYNKINSESLLLDKVMKD